MSVEEICGRNIMIRKRNVAPETAPVESHCSDVLCSPLTPHSLHPTVACLHSGVDPQGQRQATQPGHGLQRHPDHPERAARGRRRLRLHGLQHVCHGRGQCHPLRARFVIHGAPVTSAAHHHRPSPTSGPTPSTHHSLAIPALALAFFFFFASLPSSSCQLASDACFSVWWRRLIVHCERRSAHLRS